MGYLMCAWSLPRLSRDELLRVRGKAETKKIWKEKVEGEKKKK
jgi:hypothetical protein